MANDLVKISAGFIAANCKDSFFCELGEFTWENKEQPDTQKGWLLDQEIREKIADGTIEYFVLALDMSALQTKGGICGLETIINSQATRFKIDPSAFPWYWSGVTKTGGWISYEDLITKNYIVTDSGVLYLKYKIISHPSYDAFKTAMASAEWGEFAIQYGMGVSTLPIVNAFFCENF
jgi:hypothetical protein